MLTGAGLARLGLGSRPSRQELLRAVAELAQRVAVLELERLPELERRVAVLEHQAEAARGEPFSDGTWWRDGTGWV